VQLLAELEHARDDSVSVAFWINAPSINAMPAEPGERAGATAEGDWSADVRDRSILVEHKVQVLLGEEGIAVGAGIDRAEQLIEPRNVSPKGLDLVRECPPRTQRPQRPSRGESSFAAIEMELFGDGERFGPGRFRSGRSNMSSAAAASRAPANFLIIIARDQSSPDIPAGKYCPFTVGVQAPFHKLWL
jgi:hypothetical protein